MSAFVPADSDAKNLDPRVGGQPEFDLKSQDMKEVGKQVRDALAFINQTRLRVSRRSVNAAANFILTEAPAHVRMNCGAALKTITLPSARANLGLIVSILKADAGAFGVTVAAAGTDTVNVPAATFPVAVQWGRVALIAADMGTGLYSWELC